MGGPVGQRIDPDHVLTGPRGSELILLCIELALRGREPGRPVPDLAELAALHAGSCPELAARLPQVAALLRGWTGSSAQANVAAGQAAGAPSKRWRVDVCSAAQAAERLGITGSATRQLLKRDRLRGIKRHGVWRVDLASVDAYSAERAMRRLSA